MTGHAHRRHPRYGGVRFERVAPVLPEGRLSITVRGKLDPKALSCYMAIARTSGEFLALKGEFSVAVADAFNAVRMQGELCQDKGNNANSNSRRFTCGGEIDPKETNPKTKSPFM